MPTLSPDKQTFGPAPVVKGCDLSAGSGAGMATGGFDAEAAHDTQIPTRPRLTYCGPNLVLTKGSTLNVGSGPVISNL